MVKSNEKIQFEDELNKNHPENRKKKKNREFDKDNKWAQLLRFFLKFILPPIGALIFGIVIGAVFIIMTSDGATQGESPEADTINRAPTLRETIESVKDSQLTAVQQQLAALSNNEDTFQGDDEQRQAMVTQTNEDLTANADDAIEALINYSDDAGNTARQNTLNALMSAFGSSNTENEAIQNFVNDILNNQSVNAHFDRESIKSGNTFASLYGLDDNASRIYLTLTPFVADNQHYHVLYAVKINNDATTLEDIKLLATMRSQDEEASEHIYNVFADMVRDDDAGAENDIDNLPSFEDAENNDDSDTDFDTDIMPEDSSEDD